jgi:hypothetical protein
VPISEYDVEDEVYERLYGAPRRDQRNGHAPREPIVISDRGVAPGSANGDGAPVPHPPVRRSRQAGMDISQFTRDVTGTLARGLGALLAAALAGARWAMAGARRGAAGLRPTADAAVVAARRHPAPASALVWAVIALPVLVALLAFTGTRSATTRLHPAAPHFTIPATTPPQQRPARHAARPRVTTTQSTSPPAAVTSTNSHPSFTTPRQPPKRSQPKRRTTTSRPRPRPAPPPRRAPSIRQPTAHETPVRKPSSGVTPSPTTTPTTPGGTGTTPASTGGQPAPGD